MEALAADPHQHKIARIARQLRAHARGAPVSLRKKSVSHQVPKRHDLRQRDDKIDISDLTEILSIDPVRRICVAESGVTFVDLVAATLAHGLVPIVVPELKTITIGGAVSGCSIESMSFVHGGFHDTCLEYEVITGAGDVLICTPDNEHHLVFQMMHGAFGTLGILARLTFKLVPARPYVKLRYETYATVADYQAAILRHFEARDVDFMDGIIHSPTCYVLSTGDFVDTAPYTSDYSWMKIYYQSTRTRTEDYLTTPDYFFRYDRGVTNVRPRSFLGRLVLGKFLASSQWLRLGDKLRWLLRADRPTITLDVFVPFSRVPEFLAWYEREFQFYPLWCVPYRRVRDYEWLDSSFYATLRDPLFLDLAIYGMRQRGPNNYHRLMEHKLRELGGLKTLIAHNYYTEDEFWSIWNQRNYDAVKAITDPDNVFRDLYTKTCKTVMGQR
ncbi:MAG TPA: FAD-binding oxidoreductase [Kofleriaceae bacterium]|nr:FAD-binding oxidoreductase [Kofleriaceae bacterium]